VYENEHMLLINKPAGLLTQPSDSSGKNADSLIGRVKAYLGESGEYSPATVNRLDRNTSGLVICGKNLRAVRNLNKAIYNKQIKKIYLAVVIGAINETGEIKSGYFKDRAANIGHIAEFKDKDTNIGHITNFKDNAANTERPADGETEIITRFKPIAVKNGFSLLEIELVTGKSHQIRLHLQAKGYPVLGDFKYGDRNLNAEAEKKLGIRLQSQCLHAYKLVFAADAADCVADGDNCQMYGAGSDTRPFAHKAELEFTAKPPGYFTQILRKLFGDMDDILR